jgi:hypothetical protein
MRLAVALVLSVALHVVLALGARRVHARVEAGPRDARVSVDFVVLPEAPKASARVVGDGDEGVDPVRATGEPAAEAPGRAGDALTGSAPRIGHAGASPRTRMGDREAPLAVLGAIAAGIAAQADPLDTFDAREALGATPDTTLGTRGTSLVAPGTHGLDMQGTGRGSRDAELAGARDVIGGPRLGPGWLGGTGASEHVIGRGRARTICVIEGCRRRPRVPTLRVTVESGPLDALVARRVISPARAGLVRCFENAGGLDALTLVITSSGSVSSVSGPLAACASPLVRALAFPAGAAPSRLRVERRFVPH